MDKPLQVQVIVEDINDNAPVCQKALTVLEVQENEGAGKNSFYSFIHIILVLLLFPANKARNSDPKE